jgi:hypothetical protein
MAGMTTSIHTALEELFGQKIEVIDTFVEEHKIDKQYFLGYSDKLLFEICKSGNLDLLIWVAERFNITINDEMTQNHDEYCDNAWQESFDIVCRDTDHLHIAKWIYEKFNEQEEVIYINREHLMLVCMNGCAEIFDWMREMVNIQILDVLPCLSSAGCSPGKRPTIRLCCAAVLKAACIGGNTEIIKWLLTVGFKYPRDHILTYSHHVNECEDCKVNLHGYHHLKETFGDTETNPFYMAAIYGQLAALQLLREEFDIPREIVTANNNKFIYDVIDNKNKNRAEVLKWLIMQFNLTIEDIMEFNSRYTKLNSFLVACRYGHLDAVQLIDAVASRVSDAGGASDTGGISAPPAIAPYINRAIAIACDNREFPTFQWLIERFGITKETMLSLRCDGGSVSGAADEILLLPAFGGGCRQKSWLISKIVSINQIDMLNLIVERFGVTCDELRRHDNQVFKVACGRSNKNMVKYLCETVGMTIEDVSANDFYSIRTAINQGNSWGVVKYIRNYFNITDVPVHILHNLIDLKCKEYCPVDKLELIMTLNVEWYANPMLHRIHFDTFKAACVKMNFSAAAWLKDKFNFTTEEIRAHGDELFSEINIEAYDHTPGNKKKRNIRWLLQNFTAEDILRPIARISMRFSPLLCELPVATSAALTPAAAPFIAGTPVNISFLGRLITQNFGSPVKKVIEMFDLTEQDIHANNHILLRIAIASNYRHICGYLLRRYYESDVILNIFKYLRNTDKNMVASLIAEHFEFTEDDLGQPSDDVIDMIDRNRLGPKSALKLT